MRRYQLIRLAFILLLLCGLSWENASHANDKHNNSTNTYRYSGGTLHHQIRAHLSSMKEVKGATKESLPNSLTQIIVINQPASGNFLLSLIARSKDPLRRRAINAFIQTWNTMNLQQIDNYIHRAIELKIDSRESYPQGADATIGVKYSSVDGWGGWPSNADLNLKTKTSFRVDGKLVNEPFTYPGPMATVGAIHTRTLALGKHTVRITFEYEFTYQGVQYHGSFQSKKFHFRITKNDQSGISPARDNFELDAKIQASFHIAQTEKKLTSQLSPGLSFGATLWDGPDGTSPQITSYNKVTGLQTTLHCPYWGIAPELPVDLVFDVTIQDLTTGKEFMGESITVPKGTKGLGLFAPYLPAQFAEGRTGEIPIKVTLKPSRRRALSTTEITEYYSQTLQFNGLSIHLVSTYSKRKPPQNK